MEYIPLPGYWQITQDAWQAPNDIIVKAQFGGSFTGQQRYVESIDQIIQQDLLPKLQQQGHTYLGTIDLPKVSQRDQQMYAMYWKVMPSQEHHAAKGIEFKDDQGNRGLIVVHFTLSQSQYGSFANYYMQELHAPQAHYKRARKTYFMPWQTIK
ncbi:MAG: hypothetical protein U5L96_05850 [Owenweeksia sp.]|nr:hypothetical protein [Owenweeksia sp.]